MAGSVPADKCFDPHDRSAAHVHLRLIVKRKFARVDSVAKRRNPFSAWRVPARKCGKSPAQFQLRHDVAAQNLKCVILLQGEFARNIVDDAKRAERLPLGGDQRRTGVKTDLGSVGDKRIVDKAFIFQRVRNHKNIDAPNGMCTKRHVARSFPGCKAHFGLEPLAIAIH